MGRDRQTFVCKAPQDVECRSPSRGCCLSIHYLCDGSPPSPPSPFPTMHCPKHIFFLTPLSRVVSGRSSCGFCSEGEAGWQDYRMVTEAHLSEAERNKGLPKSLLTVCKEEVTQGQRRGLVKSSCSARGQEEHLTYAKVKGYGMQAGCETPH